MFSDRQSSVFAGVAVGCVAGLVAFLATGSDYATDLNAVVATTSSTVTVAPNMVSQQHEAVMPEMVSVQQAEGIPMEYEITPQAQVHSWGAVAAGVLAVPLAVLGFLLSKKKPATEERPLLISIDDLMSVGKQAVVASAIVGASAAMTDAASAYPIFAQQTYANPREATGRIVCANCHLATKETEIEVPQAVLPDQVFEAVSKVPFAGSVTAASTLDINNVVGTVAFQGSQPVEFVQESGVPVSQALIDLDVPTTPNTIFKATIKVPYDQSLKQVGAKGKPAELNVGAVVVLPEGFRLAPADRIPEKMKEEINGLQFIQYSEDTPNILVVGPVPGKLYSEMHVALLSPDPATDKKAEYGSLPIFVGGNRGRGQLYPSGEKSNNNAYAVEHSGKIVDIELNEKKRVYTIAIEEAGKETVKEELPAGAELIVKKGDAVEVGQVITTNPNVGGFGQAETEIVLQEPGRVRALLFFSVVTLATQTLLVVKKKQYEQVQLSEMNF